MRKSLFALALSLLSSTLGYSQIMSEEFAYLKKYMGLNVYGGYAFSTFKHASIQRFTESFNNYFNDYLSTKLEMPRSSSYPVFGTEISAGAIRIGYQYGIAPKLQFEAKYKTGAVRKMIIEQPKHDWFIDLLLPLSKGRVFVGMNVGAQFGYYRLHSFVHENFGYDNYSRPDGISGIYHSFLDMNMTLGLRLDVNFSSRFGMSLRAQSINTIVKSPESPIDGWKDMFRSEATLPDANDQYIYIPEDVSQAHNTYVVLGNTMWQYSPAIWGDPKRTIYSATFNVKLISFSKFKK